MTWMEGCREIRQALGVYILGAIDPAERSIVDSHLLSCRDCRDELAGLAGLPALLGRVKIDEAERISLLDSERERGGGPAEELLGSLLARVATERRVRRWRSLAVAAAAVVLAVVGALGGLRAAGDLTSARPPAIAWETLHGSDARTGVTATIRYGQMQWGTMIFVHITGARDGTWCQLWVTDSTGKTTPAGTWKFTYASSGTNHGSGYPAASPDTARGVRGFSITAGGKELVHIAT